MPTSYSDPGPIGDVVGTSGKVESTWGNAIKNRVTHRFANLSDIATYITSPVKGMIVHVASNDVYYHYDGQTWQKWLTEYAMAQRTAGDLTINGTSYADVDTGIDLTLRCNGTLDLIQFNIVGKWANNAVDGRLAVRSVNRGAEDVGPDGANGIPSCQGPSGFDTPFSASFIYVTQSGDYSGANPNTVTFRLRAKTGAAGNKTLLAGTNTPLYWSAHKIGATA